MAFFTAASKADFQHHLQTALAQHVSEQALPQVALFAEQFFGIIALEELTQRRLSDLVGCTLSSWRVLERFDSATPEVRVFNPDYEKHGWQSTHTAVEILHSDIPFLVDSARMELNRRGYSIHTLQNSVFSVRRNKSGELQEILPKGAQGKDVQQEALMFLEIDRSSNVGELKTLEKDLQEVFGDVRLSVADFQPMKAKAKELLAWLDKAKLKVEGAELEEIKVFMSWLLDDHFTFLGYEEFTVADSTGGGSMVYDEKSLLGLSKRLRSGLKADELHIEPEAVAYLREPQLLVLGCHGRGALSQALLGSPTLHLRTPPQHGRSHMLGQIVEKTAHLGYRTRTLHLQALLQMAGVTEQEGLLLKQLRQSLQMRAVVLLRIMADATGVKSPVHTLTELAVASMFEHLTSSHRVTRNQPPLLTCLLCACSQFVTYPLRDAAQLRFIGDIQPRPVDVAAERLACGANLRLKVCQTRFACGVE